MSSAVDGTRLDSLVLPFTIIGLDGVKNIEMELEDSGLNISWSPVQGATGYKVYKSAHPLFDEIQDSINVLDSLFVDEDWQNAFYKISAYNENLNSATSEICGSFMYHLYSTEFGDLNAVGINLNDNRFKKASDFLHSIPSAYKISYWEGAVQNFVDFTLDSTLFDFEITQGLTYFLQVEENVTFTLFGELANLHFELITTDGTDFNSIIVPFTKAGLITADDLMKDIPNCNSVAFWDAEKQKYKQYIPQFPSTNFLLIAGMPYLINITEDTNW